MRKSRYTDEQVAFALKQAELGTPVAEVCRKMAVSEAMFFRWKQKFGGLGPSDLRKLRQLEEALRAVWLSADHGVAAGCGLVGETQAGGADLASRGSEGAAAAAAARTGLCAAFTRSLKFE